MSVRLNEVFTIYKMWIRLVKSGCVEIITVYI